MVEIQGEEEFQTSCKCQDNCDYELERLGDFALEIFEDSKVVLHGLFDVSVTMLKNGHFEFIVKSLPYPDIDHVSVI
ncbi:MAG: hypothetical protein HRK26_02410 [Rickettsiaceae bacterium H1]|nr:hypothetical protein [Rickettsiaceae bacterium H1]